MVLGLRAFSVREFRGVGSSMKGSCLGGVDSESLRCQGLGGSIADLKPETAYSI